MGVQSPDTQGLVGREEDAPRMVDQEDGQAHTTRHDPLPAQALRGEGGRQAADAVSVEVLVYKLIEMGCSTP